MTIKSAERISGRYLRRLVNDGRKWQYAMYEDQHFRKPLWMASAYTAAEAISQLVEKNYRAVSSQVFEEQSYLCFACGGIHGLTADHIIPRARGRNDRRENLRGVDIHCHRRITAGEVLSPHPKVLEAVRKHGWRWTITSETEGWVRI